ncbi:efflux RND transporter periplasmic adaptor subunit [Halalkalibacter nanhaiisediminis]|uniref:RND family efflux transporter MFP subunit n=1 Tax=Halalkalibacter nanhaiisediminis TaxID=688079 RepID=A0A562QUL8_9BACI|nr:efflux RND transporter periplasmic adaptor subunit [Halalkalibacter nanhaiisediminis]TWI59826.1 RND family efflux transporter MFP subunit [Halalkalibacter nanhaiisediminis]
MKRITSLVGVISLVVAAGFITGCSNTEVSTEEEVRQIPVAVDLVSYGALSGSNQLSGTIEAYEEVNVAPKVAGELVEMNVEKGDIVQTGTLLARMDDTSERNALEQEQTRLRQAQSSLQRAQMGKSTAEQSYAQAQASLRQAEGGLAEAREGREANLNNSGFNVENARVALEEAQKNLERMQALYDEGLISDQDFEGAVNAENRARIAHEQAKLNQDQASSDTGLRSLEASVDQARIGVSMAQSAISEADIGIREAQIAVEQAQLSVDAAQNRLDDKRIVAPSPGEVVSVNGYVGEMISNQAAFAQILELDRVKLGVDITAEQIAMFNQGETVEVAVANSTEALSGTISYISATSQDTGLFKVEVAIDNPDRKLRPGMFGSIVMEEVLADEGILIPTQAIVEKQGESFVFIVEEGVAVRKNIEVNRFDTEFTSVTGDLKENNQIVVRGQNLLEDGDFVEVMEEE